jgi:hypothetical protein
MKRFLLICHVVAALACAALADTNIRILQVGLNSELVSAAKECQKQALAVPE